MNSLRVHTVNGHKTIYVGSRRYVMPESFVLGSQFDLILKSCPQRRAKISETGFLASCDLVSEEMTNIVGACFRYIVPRRDFYVVFGFIFVSSFLLMLYQSQVFAPLAAERASEAQFAIIFLCSLGLMAFHEIGHAATCNRLGIRADCFGAGFYLLFPAFYTKLALVKILERRDRVIVFLGGVYFQCVVQLPLSLAATLMHDLALAAIAKINFMLILLNLVPVFQFDGHKILREYRDEYSGGGLRSLLPATVFALTVAYVLYALYLLLINLWVYYGLIRQGHLQVSIVIGASLNIVGVFFLLISVPRKARKYRV